MFQRLQIYLTFLLLCLLTSKQSKEIKGSLVCVPRYFVNITALQCVLTPSLAVVTYSLSLYVLITQNTVMCLEKLIQLGSNLFWCHFSLLPIVKLHHYITGTLYFLAS